MTLAPLTEPRRAIEDAMVRYLGAQVESVDFFPNDGDNERDLPFCVVLCKGVEPIVSGGLNVNAYKASVKIVYVSHINDVAVGAAGAERGDFVESYNYPPATAETPPSRGHSEMVKHIERALESLAGSSYAFGSTRVCGLAIEQFETTSEEQSFADVITCIVGFQELADSNLS
jgi:hypothetical protein